MEKQSLIGEEGQQTYSPDELVISKAQFEKTLEQIDRLQKQVYGQDKFAATTEEALEVLRINRHNLRHWQREGVFRAGHEWIQRTPAAKAPMWWNIPACQQALADYNANRIERYTELDD